MGIACLSEETLNGEILHRGVENTSQTNLPLTQRPSTVKSHLHVQFWLQQLVAIESESWQV